jgi:hypothetical protein
MIMLWHYSQALDSLSLEETQVVWSLPGSHLPLYVDALKIITPLLLMMDG